MGRLLLAGDVGATKTNLAFFSVENGLVEIAAENTFMNAGYTTFGEIIEEFIARNGQAPEAACFGVAGPVTDGHSRLSNRDWQIDAGALGRDLGVEKVVLINDLEATAHGMETLAPDRFSVLNQGSSRAGANKAIIAAGTGLGEAILYWDGEGHHVSASEGGHADYAPCNAEQIEVLDRLRDRFGHVSAERLISGPGLRNIYDVLDVPEDAAIAEHIETATDPSAVIAETALAGTSARCVRTLEIFVAAYGAEAGNLALKALATGGVYVGGGIAPKILHKLEDGSFVRAFCDKGRIAELLRSIPVKVILDPKTALRGAAAYLAGIRP
jgi:glucokinase